MATLHKENKAPSPLAYQAGDNGHDGSPYDDRIVSVCKLQSY